MQPEARVRIIAWISWLTGRGQQSDSYYTRTYLSSVTRYLPELASLSSFARILKACLMGRVVDLERISGLLHYSQPFLRRGQGKSIVFSPLVVCI